MPTISMSEKIVDCLVKSGRYASRDDAVQEAERLLEERETILDDAWVGIEEGLADREADRVYPAEEVRERLSKRFSAKNEQSHDCRSCAQGRSGPGGEW